jgi:DNA-binding CsgD family transcriptional regulator
VPTPAVRPLVAVQCRDRLLGDTLVEWCGRQQPLVAVGPAADDAGLLRLCGTHPPDLVVLEVDRGAWSAVEVLIRIAAGPGRGPGARPAVAGAEAVAAPRPFAIGIHHGIRPDRAARLHASGRVDRLVDCSGGLASFAGAVRDFLALPRSAAPDPADYRLTPRELDVLALLGQSRGVAEIAVLLGVTRRTVENHKRHIFVKLDVHCSSHAVATAASSGLLADREPSGPADHRPAGRPPTVTLTGRERDVLALADRGYSTKQTARTLDLSAKTVENTWRHLFGKLGVHDRAGVLATVHRWGQP